MHTRKRIYDINDLSTILGFTVPAIHAHLARKNYQACPRPFHLGRRLAWSVSAVDSWLEDKMKEAEESR